MPSENVGRIVKIEVKKKKIVIHFDVFEPLNILEETYTNYYLFVDKKITKDEYEQIIYNNQINELLKMVINSLARKMYTEKEIIKKLYSKKADKKSIKYIVNYLKEHNLINDYKYALEYKEILEQKNESQKSIIYNLKNKGIAQNIIDALEFDVDSEEQKAKNKFEQLKKKYKNNASLKKYQAIKNGLYLDGFDQDIIDRLMSEIEDNSHEKEKELLIKELLKLNNRNYDEQKIIQKLRLKGFKYDLIKQVLEEVK